MFILRLLLFCIVLIFVSGCSILSPPKTKYSVKYSDSSVSGCYCDVIPMGLDKVTASRDTSWNKVRQPVGIYARFTCPGFFSKTVTQAYKTDVSDAFLGDFGVTIFGGIIMATGIALKSQVLMIAGGVVGGLGLIAMIKGGGQLAKYYFGNVTLNNDEMELYPKRKEGKPYIVPLNLSFNFVSEISGKIAELPTTFVRGSTINMVQNYVQVGMKLDSANFRKSIMESFSASDFYPDKNIVNGKDARYVKIEVTAPHFKGSSVQKDRGGYNPKFFFGRLTPDYALEN